MIIAKFIIFIEAVNRYQIIPSLKSPHNGSFKWSIEDNYNLVYVILIHNEFLSQDTFWGKNL